MITRDDLPDTPDWSLPHHVTIVRDEHSTRTYVDGTELPERFELGEN